MSEADWMIDRMTDPDRIERDVRRHLEHRVAEQPAKPKVTRRKRTPPAELPPEAAAICDAMGWGYEMADRFDGGKLALGVIRDLERAGWRLFPIPRDGYE